MTRFLSILIVFCATLITSLHSIENRVESYPGVLQQIFDVYSYDGDRHHQFQGNPVLVLTDGSAWKVHPKDINKIANWNNGDWVNASLRNDRYFFKREHKFALVNHNSKETIRAMLVVHKTVPLYIINTDTYTDDSNLGKTVYTKKLYLNDGTIWSINSNFNDFTLNKRVYVGANYNDEKLFFYFLITGKEREARYVKASISR